MLKSYVCVITPIFIALIFWNCRTASKQADRVNEFEGVITYHEVDKTSDGRINIDDTVKCYYSNGNIAKIHHLNQPGYAPVIDYFFTDGSLRLIRFNYSDTLYRLNLKPADENLISFNIKKTDEKILKRPCEEIDMTSSFNEKDSTSYTDFKINFSKGYLPIDKNHFKDWHLGHFNKVVDTAGVYFLRYSAEHFDHTHKHIVSAILLTAISVHEGPVDPAIFKIDRSKIK